MTAASASSTKYDDFYHRVYVVTNERNTTQTLKSLSKETIHGNTLVAVSGFFGLDIAAIRKGSCSSSTKTVKLENILILDRSPRMAHFWNAVSTIITKAKSRQDVIKEVKELLAQNAKLYFSGSDGITPEDEAAEWQKNLDRDIERKVSWLSDDKRFNTIKKIFDEKCFRFVQLDLNDPEAARKLVQELNEKKWTVDTIYLSNCYEFCSEREEESFQKSVKLLVAPKTYVVDIVPRACQFCVDAVQRVIALERQSIKVLFESGDDSLCTCQNTQSQSSSQSSQSQSQTQSQSQYSQKETSSKKAAVPKKANSASSAAAAADNNSCKKRALSKTKDSADKALLKASSSSINSQGDEPQQKKPKPSSTAATTAK